MFFGLGSTAFGGAAAHVALMHDEVVKRRRWLDEQRFIHLLVASNLIPGPNSTEMAIHLGFQRARWPGLIVAGAAFIVPSMVMVVILQALRRLGRQAAKHRPLATVGLVATAAIFLPSFVLVAVSNPLIPCLRASAWFASLLDGVNGHLLA